MNHLLLSATHTDEREKPIISELEIWKVVYAGDQIFDPVRRYMKASFWLDSEIVMSIEYSDILKNEQLQSVIEYFSTIEERHSEAELKFLLLRSMVVPIWKLNMQFFVHLDDCFAAIHKYNAALLKMAYSNQGIQWETNMPYWLRHIQLGFEDILKDDIKAEFMNLEMVIAKVNGIKAQCRKIGNTYIIALDMALYCYLQEWNRLLLFGYRITEYCAKYNIPTINLVKTGSLLIRRVVSSINDKESIMNLLLPLPFIPILSENDNLIIKNIHGYQLRFIIGHELGHIMLHKESATRGHSVVNEIEADSFSINILKDHKLESGSFIDSEKLKFLLIENDIQPDTTEEALLQAVDLLFGFIELVEYYRCLTSHGENDESLLDLSQRKGFIKKKYVSSDNNFCSYVEQLILEIKAFLKGGYRGMVCKIEYNDALWSQLSEKMDDFGWFIPDNCKGVLIQVVPFPEFNFAPGTEKLIEMIITFTKDISRDVAVGLFVNWLYDILKNNKINSISINGYQHNISQKKDLDEAIKNSDRN